MQFDLTQVPNWAMSAVVIILCIYTMYSLRSDREQFLRAIEDLLARTNALEVGLSELKGEHKALTKGAPHG